MKKLIISLFVVALVGAASAQSTNYWPKNTNAFPRNIAQAYGVNAAVVGASKAVVSNSIAIGGDTGFAAVVDASNAVQIGKGQNTVSGTVKAFDKYVVQLFAIDTNTTTTNLAYHAPAAGFILLGSAGSGTNAAWISRAAGSNSWTLISQ